MKDFENCPGDIVEAQVQIAQDPEYNSITSTEQICDTGQVNLIGDIEPVEYTKEIAPPITGQTFLPDGDGISYETCITVDAFQEGTTLESASDLLNIYLNIEHSYTGDLDISITAPNGEEVLLFDDYSSLLMVVSQFPFWCTSRYPRNKAKTPSICLNPFTNPKRFIT